MDAEFRPNQRRVQIEYLANKLVYGGEVQNECEVVREIIRSGIPVCIEFYKKYIESSIIEEDYTEFNFSSIHMELNHYFCGIARSTNPDFNNKIFEVMSGADEYDFDKLIAANLNPSISVKLLREIGNKKYPTVFKDSDQLLH
jgi:hypothetical protein